MARRDRAWARQQDYGKHNHWTTAGHTAPNEPACPECDTNAAVKRNGNFWTCHNPHGPGGAAFNFDEGES